MVAGAWTRRVSIQLKSSFYSPHYLCSVDAQWITAKKDWREHKKRFKEQKGKPSTDALNGSDESGEYQKDMDEMRCILYAHGGLNHLMIWL